MHERRTDLADGRTAVTQLATVVDNEMPALRAAVTAHRNAAQLEWMSPDQRAAP